MCLPVIKVAVLLIVITLDIFVFGAICPPGLQSYGNNCMECRESQSGPGCLPCSNRKFGPNCSLDCHCMSDCNPVNGTCLDPDLGCENMNYNGSSCQLQYEPLESKNIMAHGTTRIHHNSSYHYYEQGPQAGDRNYSTVAYTEVYNTTVDPKYIIFEVPFSNPHSRKRIRFAHVMLSEEPDYADYRWGLGSYLTIPIDRDDLSEGYTGVKCSIDHRVEALSHYITSCPFTEYATKITIDRLIYPLSLTNSSHWAYSRRQNINKLAVAEIEVFVCSPGTYGPDCEYTCPLRCKDKDCHLDTGVCHHGCELFWSGSYCNEFGSIEVSIPVKHQIPVDSLLEFYISVTTLNTVPQSLTIRMNSSVMCDIVNSNWTFLGDGLQTLENGANISYYANYSRVHKYTIRLEQPGQHGFEFVDPNMAHVPPTESDVYVSYNSLVQECLILAGIISTEAPSESTLMFNRYIDISLTVNHVWNTTYDGNRTCPVMTVSHYEWIVGQPSTVCWTSQPKSIELPSETNTSQQVFVIPAFSLQYGVYEVDVFVHSETENNETFYRFTKRNIEIRKGPLLAALTGSADKVHYWSEELVLNASLSYDRDLIIESEEFNYTWSCVLITGEMCVFNQSMPELVDNYTLPFTGPLLNFSSQALTLGESYIFSVTVSYHDKENSTAFQIFDILRKDAPVLDIRCLANCKERLNSDEDLVLRVDDVSDPPFPFLQYTWEAVAINSVVSSQVLDAATITGLNQKWIVITNNSFMVPDQHYYFKVEGQSHVTDKIGFEKYLVITNDGPKGGNCYIAPEHGFAVLTDFEVTCENFTDPDLPLSYRLYLLQLDGTGELLYSGDSSTMSNIVLAVGKSENYTVDLKVEISDVFGSHTNKHFSAQVAPPSAAKPEEMTNGTVVADIMDAVENRMKYFNDSKEPLDADSVQKLVTISTVLNDESSAGNDTNNTRFERRQNVRVQIVTYLANSSISDMDTLLQVADVTSNVMAVSSEITDTIQDKSVELFENLVDSFKSVPKTFISSTRKTAKTLLHVISHTLTVQSANVIKKEKEDTQINATVEDDGAEVVDKQTQKLKLKANNKKMISAVESVVNTVTETVLVPELPYKIKDQEFTLAVTRSEGLDVADMKYFDDRLLSTNETFTVNFTLPDSETFTDAVPEIKNSTSFVQILVMDENPYIWDDSYKNVTTPVMQLVIKNEDLTELFINNLKHPIEILYSTNRDGSEIQTFTLTYIYDPETNRTVSQSGRTYIVKVSIPHGSDDTLMIYIQPIDQNVTLLVYMSEYEEDITPDQTRLNGIPIPHNYSSFNMSYFMDGEQSLNLLIINATMLTTEVFYMGISVMDDQPIDVNISVGVNDTTSDGLSSDNMTIALGTFSASCFYYNISKDKWIADSCVVSPFSSLDTLQCWCDHLSVIAGGFLVLPYAIDPIADIKLFLTFFSNPVIVSTVIAIWYIYLVMLIWARRKDKTDFTKAGINVLFDNRPDEKYMYIIGVVTGWWNHAGTTANVYICLEGQDNHSDNRMLSDGSSKHFDTGNEDWFLMTTPGCLGDLRNITVWHDNTGRDPTWFLKQMVIQDIQTKEIWHFIHDNWIGVYGDHLSTLVQISAVTTEDIIKHHYYQFSLRSSLGLQNNHLWISIVCRSENNNFTRVQRLSCALSLLLTTMLTSLIFHGIPTDDPADQFKSNIISFSWADLIIGIESGLMTFPVNMIVVLLFSRCAPKPESNKTKTLEGGVYDDKSQYTDRKYTSFRGDGAEEYLQIRNAEHGLVDLPSEKKIDENIEDASQEKKKPFRFPWWVIYIAWGLVLCTSVTSSYFVMLYGLKYGYKKSLDWLVSFFTAFVQSTCITQPLKVIIIAVLLSFILKKPVEFENLTFNKIPNLGNGEEYDLLQKHEIAFDSEPVPSRIKKPLSKSQLKSVKEQLILESNMQLILQDLIVYIIYVLVVLFMVHGYRNINLCYYNTKTIEDIFIHESSYSGNVLFQEVSTIHDMWDYLATTVITNLLTGDGALIADKTMCLVGTARLRQKRLVKGPCEHLPLSVFHGGICVDSYTSEIEATGSFNKSWSQSMEPDSINTDHWMYQSATQLKTLPYYGRYGLYSGGGYEFELPNDKSLALQSLEQLQKNQWIDRFTASLFVEFTLYNPNVNLFSVVILLFEKTNVGLVFPMYEIFTAKLYHYTDGWEEFVATCEVLFVLVTFTMTFCEIKRYRKLKRCAYFSDPWNCIELVIIGLSYAVIALFFQQLITVYLVMEEYKSKGTDKFTSFYTALFWDFILRYVMSALVMLVIIKVLKLFTFHNKTKILTESIKRCLKPVVNMTIAIAICVLGFSLLGVLLFGRYLVDYQTVGKTMLTLFSFMLGVSDFYGLIEADKVHGPWYYFAFYCMIQYYFISFLVAVVMISFREVRQKLEEKQKSVAYFLFQHIMNILGIHENI